ncbi:MAG TPA: relaxation protein [Dyella sp.]|nr:relaxation protein [Dyella sp.]
MQPEEQLVATAEKAAMLMEQFERRCDLIEQHLGLLVQQVPAAVRQSSDGLLGSLPDRLLHVMQAGMGRSLEDHERRLQAAGRDVDSRAQALASRMMALERLHRHLVWKATGVALASLLLLLAGGAWLSLHYARVIDQNRLSADTLQAYNEADVSLCDGRLCANLDTNGRHYGDHGQYRLVRRR